MQNSRFPRGAKDVTGGWTAAIVIGESSSTSPSPSAPPSILSPIIFTSAKTHATGKTRRSYRGGEGNGEGDEGGIYPAVGRDGGSWRPRRASSASSSLAPQPSESLILLSTRSTRVRLASDKRAALAYERAVLRLDGDGPTRVRLTALTVLTSAGARIRRHPRHPSNGDRSVALLDRAMSCE